MFFSGPSITFTQAFKLLTSVFKLIRQDLKECTTEIWTSIKQRLFQIFGLMNIAKFLELLVIGTFIICVPAVMKFL